MLPLDERGRIEINYGYCRFEEGRLIVCRKLRENLGRSLVTVKDEMMRDREIIMKEKGDLIKVNYCPFCGTRISEGI